MNQVSGTKTRSGLNFTALARAGSRTNTANVVFKAIGPLDGEGGYVLDFPGGGFDGDALAENMIRLLCPVLVWSSRRLCR